MKKISAPMTVFYKRIFPVLWFGFIALFVCVGTYIAISTGRVAESLPGVVIPIGMAAMGAFIFKKLLSGLADEVFDAGDAFVVRTDGQEERVLLSNVKNVSFQPFVNPPRITLSLRNFCRFGTEISFIPKVRFGEAFYGKNPMVEELIDRIDAARR
jgi:hypothetical protein